DRARLWYKRIAPRLAKIPAMAHLLGIAPGDSLPSAEEFRTLINSLRAKTGRDPAQVEHVEGEGKILHSIETTIKEIDSAQAHLKAIGQIDLPSRAENSARSPRKLTDSK